MKWIKLFEDFKSNSGSDTINWGLISSRLDVISDLIKNINGEGGDISYAWERNGDVGVVVNLVRGDFAKTWDYDVDAGIISKVSNGVEEVIKVDKLDTGLDEIVNDLNMIIDGREDI
jgi:hypothetical protein